MEEAAEPPAAPPPAPAPAPADELVSTEADVGVRLAMFVANDKERCNETQRTCC